MGRAGAVWAANALGERWVGRIDPARGTVVVPAGVWPLLGLLAPAGSPVVQGELAAALGLPVADAADCARELFGLLRGIPGVRAALGFWADERVRLRPEWTAGLPAGLHGRLTGERDRDRAGLDAWAAEATGGSVDAMPVELTPDTRLVLASALTVRTDWIRPFHEYGGPLEGGEDGWGGPVRYLTRVTSMPDRAAVLEGPEGPVTELRVLGNGDISVHLLLGEFGVPAGRVLAVGIGALSQRYRRIAADRLPDGSPGPGLRIGRQRAYVPGDRLVVDVPRFTVEADHDLLARPGLFGLRTASARSGTEHRLPGLADGEPLYLDGARQRAVASFGALGFRAASVTALGAAAGSAPRRPPYLTRHVEVSFARPFGFLAVHRLSGLVLAAGWVTEPDPYVDPWSEGAGAPGEWGG